MGRCSINDVVTTRRREGGEGGGREEGRRGGGREGRRGGGRKEGRRDIRLCWGGKGGLESSGMKGKSEAKGKGKEGFVGMYSWGWVRGRSGIHG